MNRLGLLVFVAVVSIFGAQVAQAESVAIVDTQKVISESIIGKAAKNNLEGQIKKGQAKLTALKSDFDKQKAELEKQSSILSGSALESRREALQKKQEDFQRAYQDIQEKLAKSNETELKKVVDQVNEVVGDLADQRGYKFVFERDRQSVLYAADRIDITDEVVKILDKKKVSL